MATTVAPTSPRPPPSVAKLGPDSPRHSQPHSSNSTSKAGNPRSRMERERRFIGYSLANTGGLQRGAQQQGQAAEQREGGQQGGGARAVGEEEDQQPERKRT